MSMKKKGNPPPVKDEAGFKASPLLDEPTDWRKRIAGASTDDEKIEIIRELKDPSAIPILAGLYTGRSSSDLLSGAAYEAIRSIGVPALDPLTILARDSEEGFVKTCLLELISDIKTDDLRNRIGEPESVRVAVEAFADLSVNSRLVDPMRDIIVDEAGIRAVPELIRIADTHENPEIQDCAIVFLTDIASENPGRVELLEAVPMLEKQIRALEDIDVDPEIIRLIRDGPSEAATKSLLLLRTVHPRFSVVSNAIDLLRELWEQNPGNERI